ncbi:MAG: hypothetical protein ABI868_09705 [Acidobacteriota bacterium]
MCTPLFTVGVAMFLLAGLPAVASAQAVRGVVLDQTELPLPGATIEVHDGAIVTAIVTAGADGTFEIPAAVRGSTLVIRLDAFETVTMARTDASRIVLPIARAATTTEVVAPILPAESPVAPLFGSTLTATDIARMPNQRLQARESLPLLPSVIRGTDGLLRLSGARPNDSPMLLDGFDVTDPATGVTSITLAYEVVQGAEVLRDPMNVTYGDLMGALFKLETKPGPDHLTGVQGFVPRLRFQNPGLGRIEGIFPRYVMARAIGSGRARWFGAVEYNFERIVVPEVTQGSGPNIVEKSGSAFGRVDVELNSRHHLTLHGLIFPSATAAQGLSPRRTEAAAPNVSAVDMFAGLTTRSVFGQSMLLTLRAGALSHDSRVRSGGSGPSRLSPGGWRDNWFARVTRTAVRYSVAAALERTIPGRAGSHEITAAGSIRARRMRGSVSEDPVLVENERGDLVRTVQFGPSSALSAHDWPYDVALRDVWRVNGRLQLDGGARLDGVNRYGLAPSARVGFRFALDPAGVTVFKGGVGNFVGKIPLAIPAFSGYPVRTEWMLDETTGRDSTSVFHPRVDSLRLPHAIAVNFQVERQLGPGFDAQAGFTRRRSTRLATLDVPRGGGPLALRSDGTSSYREVQVSMRRTWPKQQQLFVSYVWSTARGELNDFMTMFTGFDTPLLQPGGLSRLTADAPQRWLAWGTVNLPLGLVASPVLEWHSGFPYSVVDSRYLYSGEPNGAALPAFMAVDLIAYKTLTVRQRMADVGIQLFNATNHFNPRDVYPVAGARDQGMFTNSVGTIVRGFMTIKW